MVQLHLCTSSKYEIAPSYDSSGFNKRFNQATKGLSHFLQRLVQFQIMLRRYQFYCNKSVNGIDLTKIIRAVFRLDFYILFRSYFWSPRHLSRSSWLAKRAYHRLKIFYIGFNKYLRRSKNLIFSSANWQSMK